CYYCNGILLFTSYFCSSLIECNCRAIGLGFDFRVGQKVARSLELCPVYGNRLTPYCMGLIIQMVKSRLHFTVTLHVVMCTSAYPFGDKNEPRWSSGRKCDCRTRGLGFDSRVGQSIITRLFRFFTLVAGRLELCPAYGNKLTSYYMGLITQME
ncbi:hypothetical protein SFRURICE_010708, partial [Spodoptera frugiperda]